MRATIWRRPAEGPVATTVPQALERFIAEESGHSNTFALFYTRMDREEPPPGSGHYVETTSGHAITAVRLDDGGTVYIDFQARPPLTSRSLNPKSRRWQFGPPRPTIVTTVTCCRRYAMAAKRASL